ncbi:MAG: DUF1957 domain-containing protein [Chloroflexi bacterium]|nr:DUF1957 domain-containing protein [Chloroflexota bacterium]
MEKGFFCFVLHSHLPYVRKAGRWPHGEEMLHEALAETYIPLLNALFDLKKERLSPKLTIGLTPILLEQLADKGVIEHFEAYLLEKLETVQEDVERYDHEQHGHLLYLARFYQDWYRDVLQSFQERHRRNVVRAFRQLLADGDIDILTSAATHCYLPLVERDSTIYAQLKVGLETYLRHFGQKPNGIWLPECGYRPSYYKANGKTRYKPGIEEFLASFDLSYFFTDTNVIQGGELVGKVAGDVAGPYGSVPVRKLVTKADPRPQATERTVMRPYYVQSTNVAVFGRDAHTGLQVWSAAHGYPGDFVYREFHRKDSASGLQYWRVTGADVDLGEKQFYDPTPAFARARDHAAHFAHLVRGLVVDYYDKHKAPGIVVSAYDTELFGHWWFEGVVWLREVLRLLSREEDVALATANEYVTAHPPEEVLGLPESSWGMGGGHWTWRNPDTEWMWPLIHAAELRMEQMVSRYPDARGDVERLLHQAARELLLLESSDWPFLVSTGQAREYASGRFQQHVARFNHLLAAAELGHLSAEDRRFLLTAEDLDNPFPNVDYRIFKEREQQAPVRDKVSSRR